MSWLPIYLAEFRPAGIGHAASRPAASSSAGAPTFRWPRRDFGADSDAALGADCGDALQPIRKRTERSASAITGAQYTPSTTVLKVSTPSSAPFDQSSATGASAPLGNSRNIARTIRA